MAITSVLNNSINNHCYIDMLYRHCYIGMFPSKQQPDLLLDLIAVLMLDCIIDPLTEMRTLKAGRGIATASG